MKRALITLKAILILWSLGLQTAYGTKETPPPKPCYLKLVEPSQPGERQTFLKTSSAETQYLSFLADMKLFGISFKNAHDPSLVQKDFARISNVNLMRMMDSFVRWLSHNKVRPFLPKSTRESVHPILWKNFVSINEGFAPPLLLSDRKILNSADPQRPLSFWSEVLGGFHGVTLNLEVDVKTTEEFLQLPINKGIARVVVKDQFQNPWIYALPLPGSEESTYAGVDSRFFAFLAIFSPELFGLFVEQNPDYFPEDTSLADLSSDRFQGYLEVFLDSRNAKEILIKFARDYLKHLILNETDLIHLLTFVAFQNKPFNEPGSLVVVVPGEIGVDDFMVQDNPYRPEPPRGNRYRVIRNGPEVDPRKPNMTGDQRPSPPGPDFF